MGARKEGFKKRTVAGNDRGYRIVGAFVKILSRINELIFYFGGNFEFRKHNVFCCSVNLRPNVLARLGEATIGGTCASVQTFVPYKGFTESESLLPHK